MRWTRRGWLKAFVKTACALGVVVGTLGVNQATPAQAWTEYTTGGQPGAMTISKAPIGCQSDKSITVGRAYSIFVGPSPASGSSFGYQIVHVIASVTRWNGYTWTLYGIYDVANSTSVPGSVYNYGNQTPFDVNGVRIGPFPSGAYRVVFAVQWLLGGANVAGFRIIDANGYDYSQGYLGPTGYYSRTQTYCRF